MNTRLLKLVTSVAITLSAVSVWAQDFPNKPIRLIVPFSAGGVTDVVSRALAKAMSENLKQPVVVENRTGGGGNIGADLIAKSAPDGYTVGIVTNGTMAANKALYSKLTFDSEKDFTHISLLFSVPYMVAVHPSIGVNNIQELITLLKANPGKYSFAHGGMGTAAHFAGQGFVSAIKANVGAVAYRGEAPAVSDVLGGHVPVGVASFSSIGPYYKSGALRVLALTSNHRMSQMPDVPTLAESGLKDFEIQPWFGISGPAGIPPAIVQRLHAAAVAGLKHPDVTKVIGDIGGNQIGNTPTEFSGFIKSEIPRWAALVKESGVKID